MRNRLDQNVAQFVGSLAQLSFGQRPRQAEPLQRAGAFGEQRRYPCDRLVMFRPIRGALQAAWPRHDSDRARAGCLVPCDAGHVRAGEIHAVVANESVALRGHISIGMPPSFADALSERLVTALRNAHPEATLRLVSANSGYLLEWMHRGDIDAAVLSDPKSARRLLRIEPLFDETLFLVGSNRSELSLKEAVEFRTLENRFMLLPSSGHGLRALIEGYAQETDIALTVKIEADNYSTLKSLVRNGHGVTVLPLAPIYEDLRKGTLRAAPLINPTPIRRLVISYPADRPTLRLARFAGQVMMKAIQDLATEGVWSGKMLFAGQGSGNA